MKCISDNGVFKFRIHNYDCWIPIVDYSQIFEFKKYVTNTNQYCLLCKALARLSPQLYQQLSNNSKTTDCKLNALFLQGRLNYCKTCGKPCVKTYCCNKCCTSDPEIYKKQQQTNLQKYGCAFHGQRQEAKQKRKQTLKQKYGDENYVNVQLRQQRNLQRYGVKEYVQTEEFKQKSTASCLEKYGSEFYSQTEQARQKIKNTCLQRYGVDNVLKLKNKNCVPQTEQAKQLIERSIQNNWQKYGTGNYTTSYLNKTRSLHSRYTIDIDEQEYIKRFRRLQDAEYIKQHFINDDGYFLFDQFCQYFKIDDNCAYKVKKKFNVLNANVRQNEVEQRNLFDQIQCTNKILNSRSIIAPQELDMYLPDYELAIEYNGLMYHSIGVERYYHFNHFTDPLYHYKKYQKCKQKGIRLFSIFDFEDQTKWLSIINDVMGYNQQTNGSVKQISLQESNQFIEQNSIFDVINNQRVMCLGEYFNDQLIRLGIFDGNKILRLVCKLGITNSYKTIIDAYKLITKQDVLLFCCSNCIDDWLIHNLKYQVVKMFLPIVKYFDRRKCYDPTFTKNPVQLQLYRRMLYDCGYTLYRI